MLLDINLNEISSIDIIEKMNNLPYIIFTTANLQFVSKASELGAGDYLMKPIGQSDFDSAINKFLSERL